MVSRPWPMLHSTKPLRSSEPHETGRYGSRCRNVCAAPSNRRCPPEGQALDRVYREFEELILPYSTGNTHPRFFGWVHGTGMATGIIAEMLAAAMNANCGGRDHGAIYVEKAVLDWCKSLFRFPCEASGLIVSGTSMANLIAIAVARNAADVAGTRANGITQRPARLVSYASAEVHECVAKAIEILGLGSKSLRRVPVDADFRMDVGALARAVEKTARRATSPSWWLGTAGTVNTGAIRRSRSAGVAVCRRKSLVPRRRGVWCARHPR